MSRRKTITSAEVKNRWNAQHYDRVAIVIPAGGRDELAQLAERHGQSVSAYIRSLILRDARSEGVELPVMGGEVILSAWTELIDGDALRVSQSAAAIIDGEHAAQMPLV